MQICRVQDLVRAKATNPFAPASENSIQPCGFRISSYRSAQPFSKQETTLLLDVTPSSTAGDNGLPTHLIGNR